MKIKDLSPDLILSNGRIYTLDANNTTAQAMAVKDGRVLAVGGDAEISSLAGDNTRQLCLGGRAVIPGIIDSHNHLMEVGNKLSQIRLDECESPEEMMELVRHRAKETPPGEWIIGQGWNEGNFTDGRLPTCHDIDAATSEHPVMLQRFFHFDLINSYALRQAGITRDTPDPEGGKIERDADGVPNGLLQAAAMHPVRALVPPPTRPQMKDYLRLSCKRMNGFGITSIIEPGVFPEEMVVYQSFYRDGELSVRVNLMPSWHGFYDEKEAQLNYRAKELGVNSGFGDEWVRMGGLKMGIDGGTSSHDAFMYEPFEGETEVVNLNTMDVETLHRHFRTAQEWGWDVGIHTCGDRAQDMVADTFAQVARKVSNPDARHNIIHAYFPTPRALEQMNQYNIAAVIQPTFLYWEGDLIFRDVGEQRAQNYIPARKYLDHGVVVTSSSDVTSTVSANPFVALYALVTRKNNLDHLVAPHEALSREEALRTYTTYGTWLTREEDIKGSIEVEKLADLAVLDRDYFAVPAEEIKDVQVDMTIVGGQVEWERE